MVPWKTTFLYKPGVFHFHVSESECKSVALLSILSESARASERVPAIQMCKQSLFSTHGVVLADVHLLGVFSVRPTSSEGGVSSVHAVVRNGRERKPSLEPEHMMYIMPRFIFYKD